MAGSQSQLSQLTLEEGGTAQTITIRLDTAPLSDVVVEAEEILEVRGAGVARGRGPGAGGGS